jgi:hypothetical protein
VTLYWGLIQTPTLCIRFTLHTRMDSLTDCFSTGGSRPTGGAGRDVSKIITNSFTQNSLSRDLLATRFHAGFLLGLFFGPEDGSDMFLRNVGLHGVISPKMVLFITAAVRTPNPTKLCRFIQTNPMESSPSWEANSCSAAQEFPHVIEPEGSIPCSQKPASARWIQSTFPVLFL